MIIRLSYLRDNSVIVFESSYWQSRLRPRCWIKKNFGCSGPVIRSVRPLNSYMIWVQTGVSQVGFYPKINKFILVRKDHTLPVQLGEKQKVPPRDPMDVLKSCILYKQMKAEERRQQYLEQKIHNTRLKLQRNYLHLSDSSEIFKDL